MGLLNTLQDDGLAAADHAEGQAARHLPDVPGLRHDGGQHGGARAPAGGHDAARRAPHQGEARSFVLRPGKRLLNS